LLFITVETGKGVDVLGLSNGPYVHGPVEIPRDEELPVWAESHITDTRAIRIDEIDVGDAVKVGYRPQVNSPVLVGGGQLRVVTVERPVRVGVISDDIFRA
jgi:hypothetical protein